MADMPSTMPSTSRDYELGHDTPRPSTAVSRFTTPRINHTTTIPPRFDTEAWQHIEALRALLLRVSEGETATLAAALSRLQVLYSSRAVAAKESNGCCATCKRCAVQLGARAVQCAAPALR